MFYNKLLYLLIYIHTHTYMYIYLLINIKNSGKPETIHRYWPVSEIYCTAGQTGTISGTVLTPLIYNQCTNYSVLTTFQLWKGNMTPFAIAGSKKESIIVRIHLICQLFHDHITTRAPITFQLCKWIFMEAAITQVA